MALLLSFLATESDSRSLSLLDVTVDEVLSSQFFEVSFSLVWKNGGVTELAAWGLGFKVATWGFMELAAWG